MWRNLASKVIKSLVGIAKNKGLPQRMSDESKSINIISSNIVNNDGISTEKRHIENDDIASDIKRIKTEDDHKVEKKEIINETKVTEGEKVEEKKVTRRRKNAAMFFMYSGKDYYGMQINRGVPTIEEDLVNAMAKAGIILPEDIAQPGPSMNFQRAARTDKGVSALFQVVSGKMFIDEPNPVTRLNEALPPQIRILDIIRVTKGFDSKHFCDARTYLYIVPTFAFTPCDQFIKEDYRLPDGMLEKINSVLSNYKGTHNFRNFTSGKEASDPSARRYIIDIFMEKPFIKDDMEFAVIKIKGQSFMLHQIRKMIGLTIAIIQGLAKEDSISLAWGEERTDVPRAPGVGLLLEQCHYDGYNRKFGADGLHQAILFHPYKEAVDKFKDEYIMPTIVSTEKEERSMFNWLKTLHMHHFGVQKSELPARADTGIGQAYNQIQKLHRVQEIVTNLSNGSIEIAKETEREEKEQLNIESDENKDKCIAEEVN